MQCCVRLNIGGKLHWYWREKSFVMNYRCRNCYHPKHFPSLPSVQSLRPSWAYTSFQKAIKSPKYNLWKAEVKIILTLNSVSHFLLYCEYKKYMKYKIVSKCQFELSCPGIAGKRLMSEKNNLFTTCIGKAFLALLCKSTKERDMNSSFLKYFAKISFSLNIQTLKQSFCSPTWLQEEKNRQGNG